MTRSMDNVGTVALAIATMLLAA
ncbi:MAG: hypothetical protein FD124_3767, partial [Alphaproteobacteria bacterium]